jgi:4-hydroxy-4-methyl-2-oxoglutarate aldolase
VDSSEPTGITRVGIPAATAGALTVALVADALDAFGLREQVIASAVRPIQPGLRLVGWARPIEVRATDVIPDEPYVGEMAALAALAPGDIGCYHVDPTVEAALFGELFAVAARAQGAVGAVLDGSVRDVRQMRELGFPVFASGVSPYDTKGRAEVVAHDAPVTCGGVLVSQGDLVVGDDDGVVVVPAARVADVVTAVAAKLADEHGALADLQSGSTVHEVWERWKVF